MKSGGLLVTAEVAAVLKQSALRQMADFLYRWHYSGMSICFQGWKVQSDPVIVCRRLIVPPSQGMLSQKKALSQAWISQRRALAKIEAAKNVEV